MGRLSYPFPFVRFWDTGVSIIPECSFYLSVLLPLWLLLFKLLLPLFSWYCVSCVVYFYFLFILFLVILLPLLLLLLLLSVPCLSIIFFFLFDCFPSG